MGMIGRCKTVTPAELESILADPSAVEALIYSEATPSLDLDKAWWGIHFLLTGDYGPSSKPLSWAILGGVELDGPDLGYGSPRYLRPDEVVAVAEALAGMPAEALASGFDAAALTEANVYPNIWDEGTDAADYLIHHYKKLGPFYADAAKAGHAMLLWVS
jgi:Domain of unknown function (DUF1877)